MCEKKKMSKLAKGTIFTVSVLVSALAVTASSALVMWSNEFSSLFSIKLITPRNDSINAGPVYEMKMYGDYYFDGFLEQGGASSDGELIDYIVGGLTKGLFDVDIGLGQPDIACSSFTCVTKDGDRLFGRNYDFSMTTSMIVHTNPGAGKYKSISSVDLQFLSIDSGKELDGLMDNLLTLASPYAPLDGMNEMGLSCGIYMSYQGDGEEVVSTNQQTSKPDLTSTTMLRMILDYAKDVDEAVELIKKYDLHDSANTSFHYMIADATGKSAILEWVANDSKTDLDGAKRELKIYYNDDDSMLGEMEANDDFQYITNFIVTPNYYVDLNDRAGYDRYTLIQNMINSDGNNPQGIVEDENEALEILKAVGRRNFDASHGASKNGTTVWSALYNLTDKTITWIGNEQFDNENARFTFSLS